MEMKTLLTGALLAAGLALSSAAHASIVLDGDFTSPSGGGSYETYGAAYTNGAIMGPWTVTGDSVDLIGGYWQAPNNVGGSVDLDGLDPGGITQNLTLSAGSYVLSFYLSGNPDGGLAAKSVDVSVGGVNQTFTYTTGANSHGNMMYALETLPFTVSGSSTLLSFTSLDINSPYGPVIGDVSVNAVPEPATWAMMLIGFGAIGYGVRLRKTKTAPVAA
jgi:choice-of-anchor C domain-containing protein